MTFNPQSQCKGEWIRIPEIDDTVIARNEPTSHKMTPMENNTAANPQILMEMFGDDDETCTETLTDFLDPSWAIIEEINDSDRRLHRSAVTYP